MEIIGIKKGSFVDKNTGNVINYGHFHVADFDEHVDGRCVEILKLPAKLLDQMAGIHVGDHISVTYNKFGKPDTVMKVPAPDGKGKPSDKDKF